MTTLEAIKYREGKLEILDQLQLPFASVYLPIESVKVPIWKRSLLQQQHKPTSCFSLFDFNRTHGRPSFKCKFVCSFGF